MKQLALLLFVLTSATLHAAAPVLLFTDLDSGPATGGEGVTNGAYVCLYGTNFGTSQGSSTVALNGTKVAVYKLWNGSTAPGDAGYNKICVQIAAASTTGNFVVSTSGGTSNGGPFT